jgi:hypothetical protein
VVKLVKRTVKRENNNHGTKDDDCLQNSRGNAFLWGVRKVSDAEDALGLE